MKKIMIYVLMALLCLGAVIIVYVMLPVKPTKQIPQVEDVRHAGSYDVMGTHCSGTVGCPCSGFAPITNGDVWEQSYCKKCGHHRRCHK